MTTKDFTNTLAAKGISSSQIDQALMNLTRYLVKFEVAGDEDEVFDLTDELLDNPFTGRNLEKNEAEQVLVESLTGLTWSPENAWAYLHGSPKLNHHQEPYLETFKS